MASNELPSSFEDPLEDLSVLEKLVYRSKQQPLVPLGCLATTIAVAMAAKGVRTGNTKSAQTWFRWRVGLLGFTLLALVFGSIYYDKTFTQQKKTDEELALEKAKLREKLWIEELERRDNEMKDRQRRAQLARENMNNINNSNNNDK